MEPITVDEQQYQIGRLNPMMQFHVARKILPILTRAGLSLSTLKALSSENEDKASKDEALVAIMGPATEVLASMPTEDVDFVLATCLGVVKRRSGDGWAPVWVHGAGLAFVDINMIAMIRLVVEVIKENMGGFFAVPSGGSPSK